MIKDYDLAADMSEIMAGEEYQKMFIKPKLASVKNDEVVKTASADMPSDPIQEILSLLVEASEELDEMNLTKSAAAILKTAQMISSEIDAQVADHNDEAELQTLLQSFDTL